MYLVIIGVCIFFSFINSKIYSNNEIYNNETKLKRDITFKENTINSISELNNSIINERIKRKIVVDKRLKWDLTIFYHTEEPLNPFMIAGALKIIEKETCFRFIPLKKRIPNISGIHYKYVGECLSEIGRTRKKQWQLIKIGRNCDSPGGIIHETLHALGFVHEQCRNDRDNYLSIIEANMNAPLISNYKKLECWIVFDYYQPYDYGSIMHYGLYSDSRNGGKTLFPLYPHYENTIGNFEKPSYIDSKVLNLHYCSKICRKKIYCFNDGYQDPNNCNTCKCVEGYGGKDCFEFAKPKRECGKTEIIVGGKSPFLNIKGKKNCVYHLLSKRKILMEVRIVALYMIPNQKIVCSYKNALEVKYWKNKAATGARFCLSLQNVQIKSHTSHVIIYYKSTDHRNFVFLYFKEVIGEK
uniref:Metalloendopeptidase n=1 Tax=Strongyloides stercoralis TaxID=6248 RepID=A0A0K0EJK5_STRER